MLGLRRLESIGFWFLCLFLLRIRYFIIAAMRTILIGGIKHCGKTTLGSIIAAELDYDFFDLDELMVKEGGDLWSSARELMQNLGEERFKELETAATMLFVRKIAPNLPGSGVVLALGGGVVENLEAISLLGSGGTRVYLLADSELLYRRIRVSGRPAFLSAEEPHEDFLKLYRRRDVLYRKFADLIHEVDESPAELNALRLLIALEEHYAGK